MIYWLAAAGFFFVGAFAFARPDVILAIRARVRPVEDPEAMKRRRSAFGAREVRICGMALMAIAAALAGLMK